MAPAGLTFTGGGEPEQVPGTRVSADFMRALAVEPLYGRWFTPDEDRPGGAAAIILSHQLWQRRFGGDPTVVGSVVQVSGVSRTIVGVLPDGRGYPATSQAWVPLALPPDAGGGNFLRLVGRMRDGANVEQVQSDLSAISAEFNAQNGLQRDVRVWPLHEAQVRNNRRTLLILQGTVAFVLARSPRIRFHGAQAIPDVPVGRRAGAAEGLLHLGVERVQVDEARAALHPTPGAAQTEELLAAAGAEVAGEHAANLDTQP